MRHRILVLVVAGLACLPALGGGRAEGRKAPEEPSHGTSVEMPYLIAPVSIADGKLVGLCLCLHHDRWPTSPAAAVDIRDKTPFIQDAFVRDVNATAIGKPGDPTTVDKPAPAGPPAGGCRAEIVGAGKVARLTIIQIQLVPVRPDAAPPERAPQISRVRQTNRLNAALHAAAEAGFWHVRAAFFGARPFGRTLLSGGHRGMRRPRSVRAAVIRTVSFSEGTKK